MRFSVDGWDPGYGSAVEVQDLAETTSKVDTTLEISAADWAPIAATDTAENPWYVVDANDKRRARLNCITHLLSQLPYEEVERPEVVLPPRMRNQDYVRHPVPQGMIVPQAY